MQKRTFDEHIDNLLFITENFNNFVKAEQAGLAYVP